MALSAGTRLGPYEILAPFGAGGMGEVYRAKHLKLGRDIEALKLDDSLAEAQFALATPETWSEWYAEAGYAGAMRRLAETVAARSRRTHTRAWDVANLSVRAGERDLALEWLERAFANRDPNTPYLFFRGTAACGTTHAFKTSCGA